MEKKPEIIEFLINSGLKSYKNSIFGNKSYVKVTLLQYLTQKKCFMIHITLFIQNSDEYLELFPDGLEELVRISWIALGISEKIIISSSIQKLRDGFD